MAGEVRQRARVRQTKRVGSTLDVAAVFVGDGEMAERMRALDWARTPLGPVERWPQSLRTAVGILLASGYPMYIAWGPQFVQFYNDSYRPVLGAKHPRALGQETVECWEEIWDMIGPMFRNVMATGREVSAKDLLFLLHRHGFVEECYFDFSYSAVRDESGEVGGVFVTCSETTGRVLAERRLRTLRDLADRAAQATRVDEACAMAAAVLRQNPADLPFALLYLLDTDGNLARLASSVHIEPSSLACPTTIGMAEPTMISPPLAQMKDLASHSTIGLAAPGMEPRSWPIADVVRRGAAVVIDDLPVRFGALPGGPWPEPAGAAIALPVARPGQTRPAAVLIAGTSPRLALDSDYRSFLDLVAGHVATSLSNARAHEEERRRADALAELDRAKTAFFSNASHEFRTPLTLMLGPIQDALAGPHHSLAGEELQLVHRNSLRLLKLVNSLLDFSRIEAGRIQAVYEPTDLASLTRELASVFRSAIERAGLRLVVACPSLPELVWIDREMWEKVVLNLLSNAFKATYEGEIAVALFPDGAAVRLEVRDTGTGIPPQELPHLFERFHRVQDARARTREGAGIGLALVRELVKLHGGSVDVESVVGQGSTFWVTIPQGSAHLPSDRLEVPRERTSTALGTAPYVHEALRWLPDIEQATDAFEEISSGAISSVLATRAEPVTTDGEARSRVLVADDNADMRGYLTRLLSREWAVEAVANGRAALASARARPPDLVLADVMMPGLDGFGLLRALRTDPSTSRIPIILVSARAGQEATVEGLESGADDYLVKPFSAQELLARVRTHLKLARVRDVALQWEQAARAQSATERQRLHDLFIQAPAVIAVLQGPDHVFELANARYEELIGRRDVTGKSIREAIPEFEGQGIYEQLDHVYATGEPFVGTERAVHLDRNGDGILLEGFFSFVYQPLRNAVGAVDGIFVHAVDVTEQVQARERMQGLARTLRDERDRLRQVLDVLPAAVALIDASGTVIMSNRTLAKITGQDVTGRSIPLTDSDTEHATGSRHLDGTPYTVAELPLTRSLVHGETVVGEQLLLRHAVRGHDIPILADSAPLRDADGAMIGAVLVFQDIAELKAFDRQKDEFLANVAHDLNNPLMGIRGQAQLMQRRALRPGGLDPTRLRDGLTEIERVTERMAGMVTELLDVARLRMGRPLDLERTPVDLVGLARRVVEQARRSTTRHQLNVEMDLPALVGSWDEGRLERVLENLLGNAIKYSPDEGTITLRVARLAGPHQPWALLAIRDHGLGIPPTDLPHIFERFHRGSNVRGRVAGTGIGLSGVRQVVEQHGGTIDVESTEGHGSTFTVRLPLGGEDAPAAVSSSTR